MPTAVSNPSFEQAGGDAGTALDWTYTTTSSLYEYATFRRSDASVVVDTVPATNGAGVTVTTKDDGTSLLVIATGKIEGFESFEFGWSSNQFYELALPIDNTQTFVISGAKPVENFEEGWGLDVYYVVGRGSGGGTIEPVRQFGMSLPYNAYNGDAVDVGGERSHVLSNSLKFIILSDDEPLINDLVLGELVRVITGPFHDGLLTDLDLLETESQTEDFESDWPWLPGLPAAGQFLTEFAPAIFCQITESKLKVIKPMDNPEYANSFKFRRFVPASGDGSVYGQFMVVDGTGKPVYYTFSEDNYAPSTIIDFTAEGSTPGVVVLEVGGFTDHAASSTRNVIGRVITLGVETRKIVQATANTVIVDKPFNNLYPIRTRATIAIDSVNGTDDFIQIYAPTVGHRGGGGSARPRITGNNSIRAIMTITAPVSQGTYTVYGDPGYDLARGYFDA